MKRQNNADNKYGLIGKLYHNVLPKNSFLKLKVIHNMSRKDDEKYSSSIDCFRRRWLGITDTTRDGKITYYWSDLVYYDAFNSYYDEDATKYFKDIDSVEETIRSDIQTLKNNNNIQIDEKTVITNLIDALNTINDTGKNNNDKNLKPYDKDAKNRLIKHIKNNRKLTDKLPEFIRLYLSFALTKSVPNDFSENTRTKHDLEEFNECVIKKFGVSSKHAVREIYRLATRNEKDKGPNTTAIYEYADILYFGKTEGIDQDIKKAYSYYKQAACLDNRSRQVLGRTANANPLALWSLAYIYFGYRNPLVEEPIRVKQIIDEIDEWSLSELISEAYDKASLAYDTSKLPAAANTLGLIRRFIDEDIYIEENRKKLSTKDIQEINELKLGFEMEITKYFEEAAKGGFLYGYNNLAEAERRKIIQEIDNPEKQIKHLEKYIEYLINSTILFDPYAANKLGRVFLEGFRFKDPYDSNRILVIDSIGKDIEIQDIFDQNNSKMTINTLIQPDLSYKFFKKAVEFYGVFYEDSCAWACKNLKDNFMKELKNDSEIDKKHLESILNKYPEVKKAKEKQEIEIHSISPLIGPSKRL